MSHQTRPPIFLVKFPRKDEFLIEPRYAHIKNLDKSEKKTHILETNHPRALKFDKFPFFLGFLIVKLFS